MFLFKLRPCILRRIRNASIISKSGPEYTQWTVNRRDADCVGKQEKTAAEAAAGKERNQLMSGAIYSVAIHAVNSFAWPLLKTSWALSPLMFVRKPVVKRLTV